MPEGALADVVVLELATGVAGPYCGKLLADLGAQVVKVEPPAGDPVRAEWPLVNGESAFFAYLNENKRGAALMLDDPAVAALAAHADIIVHSERGAAADALESRLAESNPHAVVVSLSPYGRSGPRAGWVTTPFTEWATGGFHYFAGNAEREPIALPGYQAEFQTGVQAAIAALTGVAHARATGEGQRIEISHQEATLSCHAWLTTTWTHTGKIQMRTGSLYAKCADGYIFLFNLVPYANLFVLIERFDLLEDETLMNPPTWWERFGDLIYPAFSEWAATRTKQEIYHAGQELRIAISPVNTMADVANNQQLAARGSLGTVVVSGRAFVATGFPYHLSGTPCAIERPAPALGQHTAEVLSASFAWANAGLARPNPRAHAGEHSGPLAGIRLIEVTGNWAGPIGGRHLADLGADVIKVELASKPATRTLVWVNDDMTWPEHYHRSAYFNKLNRNKRAVCLDLSRPEGRKIFLDLVSVSDAVLENNAARVMGQLGLGYDALREVNPKVVLCSMSGYGGTGPERNYSAYGSNIETSSGLASLNGYGPGEYYGTGTFYADPVTGNHGAVALLAALHHAKRTGEGQWIDMALMEAVLPFFSQQFLRYSVTGEVMEPMANRSPVFAPQGVYATLGRDCWLAVTVRDEHDWRQLCAIIGRDDLGGDRVLAGVDGRRARAAEIDAAIGAWAATMDHNHATAALQAAGVPAAPVMQNWEIVSDNHLNQRGFFQTITHAEAGTFPYPGFPWRFERTPGAIYCPAPMFAEHNHEVFGGLLGLTPEEVAGLYAAGVTGDEPIFANGTSL
ncbi:MAG: CoA transferase [Chloroflexi bacterium]|nr:CoA transferase [Chloroflexota bacterium]